MKRTAALRKLLGQADAIVVPGATDALTARLVEEAGFPIVYFTGAGFANTQFAVPDVGLTTMTEVVGQLDRICEAVSVPILADGDTGYGNAISVRRTVRAFEKAGVAGIQLEDQEFPKRCGHFDGKRVVSAEEMVNKIRAALDARRDADFVVLARTDALTVLGIDQAVERAQMYAAAGADALMIESPRTIEEMRRCATPVPGVPSVANMVEGGLTPILSMDELQAMGFKLIVYANSVWRAAVATEQAFLRDLKSRGDSSSWLDRMIPMAERKRVTHLPEVEELERRYGR